MLTQTITNPGGPFEQNHFDSHFTVLGTGIGQTTGIQYVTNETFHNSEAGKWSSRLSKLLLTTLDL